MNSRHKPQTHKHYQERINLVWLFIQNNLDEKLQLEALAKIALLSPYHFHRIFTALTGESIIQYVRRLRLERAANKILYSDLDITTIGLDNGYETPAAFSRAFKQQFGLSPTVFRKTKDLKLKDVNTKTKLTYDNNNKKLEYSIVHFKPTRVLFIRKTGDYMESAFEAWECLMTYAKENNLMTENSLNYGIPLDSPDITAAKNIRYDACITVDDSVKPDGEYGIQIIKGGRYAVFIHYGPYQKLEDTYNQIILNWLPDTNYELMDAPAFEHYLNSECFDLAPEELITEIYIPIQ